MLNKLLAPVHEKYYGKPILIKRFQKVVIHAPRAYLDAESLTVLFYRGFWGLTITPFNMLPDEKESEKGKTILWMQEVRDTLSNAFPQGLYSCKDKYLAEKMVDTISRKHYDGPIRATAIQAVCIFNNLDVEGVLLIYMGNRWYSPYTVKNMFGASLSVDGRDNTEREYLQECEALLNSEYPCGLSLQTHEEIIAEERAEELFIKENKVC